MPVVGHSSAVLPRDFSSSLNYSQERAAAERISLLEGDEDGVVKTVPGLESTDTGTLDATTLLRQLFVAVNSKNAEAVTKLCSSGNEELPSVVRTRDSQGHSLMHWAAKGGNVGIIEALADAGCPTGEVSEDNVGMSPLHWAATEGRLMASAWLLGPGGVQADGRDKQAREKQSTVLFLLKFRGLLGPGMQELVQCVGVVYWEIVRAYRV
ncbi:unnamed protein product [Choristocarpus tenellus]